MEDNPIANEYVANKDFDELDVDVQIELGRLMANAMLSWGTNKNYEPWEFSSEEQPYFVRQALDKGLIRKRKSHVETITKIVYDED